MKIKNFSEQLSRNKKKHFHIFFKKPGLPEAKVSMGSSRKIAKHLVTTMMNKIL